MAGNRLVVSFWHLPVRPIFFLRLGRGRTHVDRYYRCGSSVCRPWSILNEVGVTMANHTRPPY